MLSPQADCHLPGAAANVLGAASSYCDTKRSHNNTYDQCRVAGVDYRPIVVEVFGGLAEESKKVLDSINRIVAENTNCPVGQVAQRFWTRLSIDLQRSNHRAWERRVRACENVGVARKNRWMAASMLEAPLEP